MHLSASLWKLRSATRNIWVRIALISAMALIAAIATPLISPLLPDRMKDRIDAGAATDLLSILTNSMLAVATFSLSVMVAAHHYAASQVTPRSHRLLREDGRTQSVLATFIGAFVYALVAIVIINAGLFAGRDYAVVYGMTIIVIALVIVALVRWVQHLSGLGSVEATTSRVEAVTRDALVHRMQTPWLGGRPATTVPDTAIPVQSTTFGWVQHLDMASLSDLAKDMEASIHLAVQPGDRVVPGMTLLCVDADRLPDGAQDDLRNGVVVGKMRSFEQDPIFGLEVMSEIAQRALSPGLNDPRTATDIIARQHSLLSHWASPPPPPEPEFPRLYVPSLLPEACLAVALDHIARDGAHLVEIQMAVQHVLRHLSHHDSVAMQQAARELSARALRRLDDAMPLEQDRERVRQAAP